MNRVDLLGRLVRDPQIRYITDNKMPVAMFTIAVDRRSKDKGADYINCTAFGKLGEVVERYFVKGKPIAITGRLQTSNFTTKEGKNVHKMEVIADTVEFVPNEKKLPTNDMSDIPEGFEQLDTDMPF